MTMRKAKLAWKFRRPLWKYRKLVARRREIAGVAVVGAIVVASIMMLKLAPIRRAAAVN